MKSVTDTYTTSATITERLTGEGGKLQKQLESTWGGSEESAVKIDPVMMNFREKLQMHGRNCMIVHRQKTDTSSACDGPGGRAQSIGQHRQQRQSDNVFPEQERREDSIDIESASTAVMRQIRVRDAGTTVVKGEYTLITYKIIATGVNASAASRVALNACLKVTE